MKSIQIIVLTLIFSFFVGSHAAAKVKDFNNSEELPKILQNLGAEKFSLVRDGVRFRGAVVGPEDGKPALLISGFGSSAGYLSDLAAAKVKEGYRVYTMNPTGFGKGEFASEILRDDLNEHDLNITRMALDATKVLDFIYKKHNSQKVLLAGHSLGGIIIRVMNTGLVKRGDRYYFSDAQTKKFLNQVDVVGKLASPSPVNVTASWGTRMIFSQLIPMFAKLKNSPRTEVVKNLLIPKRLRNFTEQSLSYLQPLSLSYANLIYRLTDFIRHDRTREAVQFFDIRQFVAVHEAEFHEIVEFLEHAQADEIPAGIIDDVISWIEDSEWEDRRTGLNFRERYINLKSEQRPKVAMVIGDKDLMVHAESIYEEAELIGAEVHKVGTGHMGPTFGSANSALTAQIMIGLSAATSCYSLF